LNKSIEYIPFENSFQNQPLTCQGKERNFNNTQDEKVRLSWGSIEKAAKSPRWLEAAFDFYS
jgi:hypothetical protein